MDDEQKPEPKNSDADYVIDEKGKLEETHAPKPEKTIKDTDDSRWRRFTGWYKSNKKKSIPLTILVLLLILAAVPWSRYHIAGLALKKDLSLQITDATAGTPVSGADVSIGSVHALTDGSGKATLHDVKVGPHTILVSKKYYKDSSVNVLVPIFKQKTTPDIKFSATGRQVKISVKNLINNTTITDADIKVADINAKTDQSGSATIVLPAGTKSEKATLSADGYNTASVTVQVDNKTIKENIFKLTPVGKVYFLSKLSGKIDVVKTNLDGSSRQTVLAGTGREDDRDTILLASRDWKYLALLSHREGGPSAKLYLVNTADDSMTTMDTTTNANFNPVGWNGHNFVYTLSKINAQNWQPGAQALKSYDAEAKRANTLDQTRAEGTSDADYAYESYGNVYQVGKNIIYEKSWTAYYYGPDRLSSKKAGIYSISASGSNAQTLKTFGYAPNQNTYISSITHEAYEIYYQVYEKDKLGYYVYSNGKVTQNSTLADDYNRESQQAANTYLQSPSGNAVFWGESRDGKNTLFIGDDEGENGKQIATLSDYQPYGWYTDDYLLVSKNASELYIMPKSGGGNTQPIKITDYHKPARSFVGYGGGYGGL